MQLTPFIFLAFGLFLIFLEFYLPGAVVGSIGALMVVAALVVFALESHSIIAISLFTILAVVCTYALIKYMLWSIPRANQDYSIYSHSDQHGFQASTFDATAIGKVGVVLSDLKPGGYILVDNKKHQAISQAGYISQGTEVMVVGGQEESLLVKPL